MNNTMIKTKFGKACLNKNGYYTITTSNEHYKKFLHKLIIEDFYNTTLPDDWVVHHDDGDKSNNNIWNLIPMPKGEHSILHNNGENNPMFGVKHTFNKMEEMSRDRNTSGYFRVNKHKSKEVKQGFMWRYQWYDDVGKRHAIASVDMDKLEEKVKARNLPWMKL